jgi:putative ABC transport system permease protein
MEIGPIFRSLIHHKTRFWLITFEIALTLAIVANCINMILDQRSSMLRLMRALPGVRAATGTSAIPLSGGGSATGRRATGTEIDPLTAPYFFVDSEALETFGVELAEGRDFVESDFVRDEDDKNSEADEVDAEPERYNVIVSQGLADVLFPDGGALGSTIEGSSGGNVDTVVGIIEHMHCAWPTSPLAERVMLYPDEPWSMRRARFLVRTEPGMIDELYTRLETDLLDSAEGRLVTVRTLKEIKDETYSSVHAVTKMLGGVSVLLVVVTSLGIIGLTSFSVTQRTREIGTRRALGATRLAILRYFLVENWLITAMGLTLGILLTYGLNFALARWSDVQTIGMPVVAGGMILIWCVGLLAALVPAIRGTSVPPVLATQTV